MYRKRRVSGAGVGSGGIGVPAAYRSATVNTIPPHRPREASPIPTRSGPTPTWMGATRGQAFGYGKPSRDGRNPETSATGIARTVLVARLSRAPVGAPPPALMVTVANASYTGLGVTLAPDARLDDGLLDVRVVGRFSKTELVRHFWSIAFGRRAFHPRISTDRAATVRIEAARPLFVRADAHDLGTTPVEITVRPRCLWVVAPPDGEAAATAGGR